MPDITFLLPDGTEQGCHVYVDPAWIDRLPPPEADELERLEFTASERRPTSRLSCRVPLTAGLQGLVVQVPDEQW
jgi:2Fe-2S ferredoxin